MKKIPLQFKLLSVGLYTFCFSATAAQWELPSNLLGEPAPSSTLARTIVIKPNTEYVRVESGETIRFISQRNDFTWHFDGPKGSFDLAQIAPSGILDRPVRGYVDPNPLYQDK